MATIAQNSDGATKMLIVDANGYLKIAEQGDWLPSAKGKTLLIKGGEATDQTVSVYTVTAGKTFYIVYAQLTYHATDNEQSASLRLKISSASVGIVVMLSKSTPTYQTSDSGTETFAPAVPMPVEAGDELEVASNSALLTAKGIFVGWEE